MVGTSNQSVPGMAIPSCLEAPMGVCKASQSASIPASASWLEKTLKEPPVKCYEAKNLVLSSNKPDLLGGLEHLFFFHILGIVIPTDQYFSLRTHKADGFFISLIRPRVQPPGSVLEHGTTRTMGIMGTIVVSVSQQRL